MVTNQATSRRRTPSADPVSPAARGLAVGLLTAALMTPVVAIEPAAAAPAPSVSAATSAARPVLLSAPLSVASSMASSVPAAAAPALRLPRRCRTDGKVICVDARRHKVRAVEDGTVLFSFDARLGRRSLPTRRGTFRVYSKDADHVSRVYRVPMPYSMFFSGGQAIHYSRDFARHGYGVGSHGCVNLRSRSGARRLYTWAPVGTRVVVR